MFNDAETKKILSQSGLFKGLDKKLLGEILAKMSRETWLRKRSVPAQEVSDRVHIILSGRLQVVQINPETGRMVTLFLLAPGDAFDMLELLTRKPCQGIMLARDNLDLLTMSMDDMRKFILTHPEINRSLLPYLGHQMRSLSDLAGDLALHDTETRLAHLIMRHIDEEDPHHSHLKLINDLSHEVLAEMIGSVRAVVNRQLQHWRQQGIVNLDHGHIEVKQLQVLLDRAKSHPVQPQEKNI